MSVVFFFLKQKTAYEMRISDWSSDVCSSDLDGAAVPGGRHSRRLHHLFFVQPRILAVVRARAGCAGGLLYPRLGGDRHRGVRRRDARDAAIADRKSVV